MTKDVIEEVVPKKEIKEHKILKPIQPGDVAPGQTFDEAQAEADKKFRDAVRGKKDSTKT